MQQLCLQSNATQCKPVDRDKTLTYPQRPLLLSRVLCLAETLRDSKATKTRSRGTPCIHAQLFHGSQRDKGHTSAQ